MDVKEGSRTGGRYQVREAGMPKAKREVGVQGKDEYIYPSLWPLPSTAPLPPPGIPYPCNPPPGGGGGHLGYGRP